jgi:N-acetylmuramoyl-L-alanine amidase
LTENTTIISHLCKEEVEMKRVRKTFLFLLMFSTINVMFLTSTDTVRTADAFSNQVLQRGSTGNDVIELQARLQYIGLYKAKIDGVFGWGTYWGVRNFQKNYGLKVDGVVGSKTKQKLNAVSKYYKDWVLEQIRIGSKFTHYGGTPLEKQTQKPSGSSSSKSTAVKGTSTTQKSANVPSGFSQNDIKLMANAVYGEARGEPYIGQVAVAAVILNRVSSPSFPNTVSGVIFEPRAFTAVADGQIWLTPNESAKKAVMDAMNGWDPTGGAIYYFNPATATSKWIWSRPLIKTIGKHRFCR